MSRRQQIEEMLNDDPADIFLRYALAMELQNEELNDRSLEILAALRAESTPYIPAFFMAGKQLASIQRVNEAREVLRDGIGEARKQGDLHAAGEMSEFLTTLGSEGE